jgi:hypothetical protein
VGLLCVTLCPLWLALKILTTENTGFHKERPLRSVKNGPLPYMRETCLNHDLGTRSVGLLCITLCPLWLAFKIPLTDAAFHRGRPQER